MEVTSNTIQLLLIADSIGVVVLSTVVFSKALYWLVMRYFAKELKQTISKTEQHTEL